MLSGDAEWGRFDNNLDRNDDTLTVKTLWQNFKNMLQSGIKKFIPLRIATKNSLPWLTTEVKNILRKHDKLYVKMKKRN